MADEIAGQVVVQILGEASLKQIKAEVKKTVEAAGPIVVPVELKLAPKAVTGFVAETKKQLAAVRYKPQLEVGLKLRGSAVNELVAETREKFIERKDLPRLPARLTLANRSVPMLVAEASAKISASKKRLPKLKVDLDLDTEQMELVRELRAKVKQIEVNIVGDPIDIPLDLDEKSIARVSEKAAAAMAVIQARIDAQMAAREELRQLRLDELRDKDLVRHEAYLRDRENMLADAAAKEDNRLKLRAKNMQGILDEDLGKVQNRMNEAMSRGLDARSMAELRFQQRRQLMHEKADMAIRRSSTTSLRVLRNDLSSFDATFTRIIRRLGFVFAGFTAGVVASFGAIGVAALKSFADTEIQLRRTAAVLGGGVYSKVLAQTEDATKAQAAYTAEVLNTENALRGVVEQTALATIFDPTEIAAGTRALAQAGLTVDQIQGSLKGVAQFAQNEELLPEEAVASLVQGATAAGESLDKLAELGDKFTFVANDTTSTAKELADAFANRAAPAFNAYGEKVSATLTVLDLFARAGIRGKTAGEQVGILIREINKASTKTPATAAAWEKYGIAIGKVNGVQTPFLKTLSELGVLLNNVRVNKGAQELAKLRKELGLTEKSGAGLLQILPQVAKLGESGVLNVQKRIEASRGALQRQSDIITNTLSFQTDRLANQISLLFKIAAAPTGKALTKIFKEFGDQMEAGEGAAGHLANRIGDIGIAIRNEIIPAVRAFFFGGQGADFFRGVMQMYRGFLGGLQDAFTEFRKAAFGENDRRGFFTVLGQSLANFGDFAAASLPRIGRTLGVITQFVRENEGAVRAFARFTAAAFIANKALRLLIVPIENITSRMKFLRNTMESFATIGVAQTVAGWASGMRGYIGLTEEAAKATRALTAAQAAQAAAQASGATGFLAFSKKADVVSAKAAIQPTTMQKAGKIAGSAMLAGMLIPFKTARGALSGIPKLMSGLFSVSLLRGASSLVAILPRIAAGLMRFAKFAGPIGLVVLAIEAGVGVVKGFFEELRRGSKGNSDFANSMRELKPIFDAMKETLLVFGRIVMDVLGIVFDLGKTLGRFFAGFVREGIILIGDLVRGIKELLSGNFTAAAKAFGDVLVNALLTPFKMLFAFIIDGIADIVGALGSIPGIGGWAKDAEKSIRGLAAASRDFRLDMSEAASVTGESRSAMASFARAAQIGINAARNAVDGYSRRITVLGVQTIAASKHVNAFRDRSVNLAAALRIVANRARDAASYQRVLGASSRIADINMRQLAGGSRVIDRLFEAVANGSKKAADRLIELRAASIILARDKSIQSLTEDYLQLAGSIRLARAEAYRRQVAGVRRNANASLKAFRDEINSMMSAAGDATSGMGGGGGAAGAAADAVKEVKTAAEQATEAVNKLSQAQLNRQATALVSRVTKAAAGGYKATAREAEILRRVLPGVEAQLERQQAAVTKLDEALQALQATQLKGTKAFSDQTFAIEQNVKQLQLQRLDLVIAGTPEEDAAVKALDDQISKLQQQAERLSLVESLQLDPLKRKLEETFNPVKELGFDEIIKQFDAIQKQKAPLTDAIAGGENLKATLEATIKDAEARFGEAGKMVTVGFANGIKATTPQVTAAGKASGQAALNGVNQVMAFGSPSRTMIQRGEWVAEGFVVGINNGSDSVQRAGVMTMWSFLSGMRNVYENRVKPFIISIAEWIKENKGPVSYDATLLRPAGEAMMHGFKRGLTDGFGEIQSWVRNVGPQLANDSFPKDIFVKRSARFLINNARMDTAFNPEDAFGDLVFDAMGIVGGDIPQSLAFLHKTLSSADTLDMATKLARMFNVNISDFLRPPGTLTTSGNVSDHTKGTAVDFSNGTRPTPQMDALHAAIEPLLGKVFKQILYRTMIGGNHFNHVHAAWLTGEGFSMNSGKKGGLSFPGASDIVNAALAEASSKTGVNPMLLAAIAKAESGFDPRAGSPAGAQGLMQLMPGTARGLGVTSIFDPFQNALGGAKYIRNLLDQYGSIRLALAGYNAGPGNVARYNGVPPFSETLAYIDRVMRYFKSFSSGNFRAQGGKVNAMTPYIVGERGQEMFIPSQNGSVVSNRDLRNLITAMQNQPVGNGGTTVYDQRQNHIYSNTTDAATVAALVDSRMRSQIVGVRR